MAIQDIKTFSQQAKADAQLAEKVRACQKVRDLLKVAKEYGHNLDEVELYPPNEPQFTADQLSPRLVDALLRA